MWKTGSAKCFSQTMEKVPFRFRIWKTENGIGKKTVSQTVKYVYTLIKKHDSFINFDGLLIAFFWCIYFDKD
jgi:hypothetical protein